MAFSQRAPLAFGYLGKLTPFASPGYDDDGRWPINHEKSGFGQRTLFWWSSVPKEVTQLQDIVDRKRPSSLRD